MDYFRVRRHPRLTGVEYERAIPEDGIASLGDCTVVLRNDKIEIENLEPEANESEEAVEMEVSRPFVRKISLNQACAGALNFTKVRARAPQARPSAKGELQ